MSKREDFWVEVVVMLAKLGIIFVGVAVLWIFTGLVRFKGFPPELFRVVFCAIAFLDFSLMGAGVTKNGFITMASRWVMGKKPKAGF